MIQPQIMCFTRLTIFRKTEYTWKSRHNGPKPIRGNWTVKNYKNNKLAIRTGVKFKRSYYIDC